jgi:hypothetical protein
MAILFDLMGGVMHEFIGDLLIGGMRLHHVHGEFEVEHPRSDTTDWIFSGHLHVSEMQGQYLELDRRYRLELEDGRGANVFVSHIGHEHNNDLVISFEPESRPALKQPSFLGAD